MTQEETNTLKDTVISVLKTIYDPEIPVDIWTLHLIYGVDVDEEGNVKIVMTVTAPNCPVAEVLPAEVKQRIEAIMGVKKVDVELTFDPVWSIDMLSDEAKAELGLVWGLWWLYCFGFPVLKNPVSHVIPAEVCALHGIYEGQDFCTVLEAIDPMQARLPAQG